jgi:hypothetical protein
MSILRPSCERELILIWSIKRMSVILCPNVHTYEAKWFLSLPESTKKKIAR